MRISDWSSDVCSSDLQDVGLRREVRVRRDRARLGQNLAALHVLAAHTAQQRAEVVARLARVQQLAEHLDARADRLLGIADAHELDLVAHNHEAALDAPAHHPAAPRTLEQSGRESWREKWRAAV